MTSKLRTLIPLAILLVAGIGFATHTDLGTLSSIGWQDISILCPLGALGTMLASKTVIPRAAISLAIALVGIVLVGRAFCAWACPVPVLSRLRHAFDKKPSKAATAGGATAADGSMAADGAVSADSAAAAHGAVAARADLKPLTAAERRVLKGGCTGGRSGAPQNSRHLVLAGALLSTAVFGFPVFCLVCPIGLSFAFVFVLIMLFGGGDVTWSAVVIPALLLAEVVFFRKWCSHICPLSALMSLVGKLNRTLRPAIDDTKCLETARGAHCGRCADVCEVGIDPRHPELGADWSECTRCRKCVESCPGKALSLPFLPAQAEQPAQPAVLEAQAVQADPDGTR